MRVGDTYLEYGCYGDASLGRAHIRAKLAELVLDFCAECEDVIVSLYGDAPDDAWDEYKALELLNKYTGEDGYWELYEGDLCLTYYPEEAQ